jgi:GT2 family glycosyltransferase
MSPSYGAVVLTQGRRPEALAAAVGSLLAQRDVDVDVVVVGNGWSPTGLPVGVRAVPLPVNVGIPAGRNAGVPHVHGELLVFLDDDAALAAPDALARMAAALADPSVGCVQPRPVDPATGATLGRWVPRLRVGDPARSSDVTALWEGCVAVRRGVFERAGGWPAEFFYAHEGIELAWRVWDAGLRVRYLGDVVVHHPVIDPRRHRGALHQQARNRVWLARRNLPLPLAAIYPLVWLVLSLARARDVAAVRELFTGFVAGLREPAGARRPVSWRAVWRMARARRPPVI